MRKNPEGVLGAALCVVLALAAWLPACAAPTAAPIMCSLQLGESVILTADSVDPDVFVWDSRPRLLEYAAGNWGSAKDIFSHTTLIEPGTQAVVIGCHAHEAHPKYEPTDEDVIGVRIVSGRHRNLLGWVIASDVHALRGDETTSDVR